MLAAFVGGGISIGLSMLGVAWKLGGLATAVKSLEHRMDRWEQRRFIYVKGGENE